MPSYPDVWLRLSVEKTCVHTDHRQIFEVQEARPSQNEPFWAENKSTKIKKSRFFLLLSSICSFKQRMKYDWVRRVFSRIPTIAALRDITRRLLQGGYCGWPQKSFLKKEAGRGLFWKSKMANLAAHSAGGFSAEHHERLNPGEGKCVSEVDNRVSPLRKLLEFVWSPVCGPLVGSIKETASSKANYGLFLSFLSLASPLNGRFMCQSGNLLMILN